MYGNKKLFNLVFLCDILLVGGLILYRDNVLLAGAFAGSALLIAFIGFKWPHVVVAFPRLATPTPSRCPFCRSKHIAEISSVYIEPDCCQFGGQGDLYRCCSCRQSFIDYQA